MTVDLIDVRDLVEHPGTSRRVHLHEPVAFHTELADLPDPIDGEFLLEGLAEGVYVSGSVDAPATLRCARCLAEFPQRMAVTVAELVPREQGPEDDYVLGDDLTLDPEPLVRDAIALELPFAPLCSPTCLGLCPRCGGDRNRSECTCSEDIDPRWAALERFRED